MLSTHYLNSVLLLLLIIKFLLHLTWLPVSLRYLKSTTGHDRIDLEFLALLFFLTTLLKHFASYILGRLSRLPKLVLDTFYIWYRYNICFFPLNVQSQSHICTYFLRSIIISYIEICCSVNKPKSFANITITAIFRPYYLILIFWTHPLKIVGTVNTSQLYSFFYWYFIF